MIKMLWKKIEKNNEENTNIIERATKLKRLDEVEPNLLENVFNFLKTEFSHIKVSKKLNIAKITSGPLLILRTQTQPISVWYRLPIKGESGNLHIPDFVGFRGNYRLAPREKNPEIIIECRQLPKDVSNLQDLRFANEIIGRTIDTLPFISILVTNRSLSEYAKSMLDEFGIKNLVIKPPLEDIGFELFKFIMVEESETREKIREILEKSLRKLEYFYKTKKERKAREELSRKKGALREKIMKLLSSRPNSSALDISSVLKINESIILNELYVLEKEGRVKIKKKLGDIKKDEWILIEK